MFLLWWLLQIHSNKSTDIVNAIISLCGRPSAVRACRWGCWSSLADGCRQAILPDRCRKPPEFWRLWAPWVPPPYRYRPYPAPRCQPVTYERQLLAHVPHAIRDRLLELEGVALPVKIKKLYLTESPIPIFKYL